MTTQTMLGLLDVTRIDRYDTNYSSGSPTGSLFQPTGTPLRNDGIHRHWMLRGESYRLEHDGTGWRVHNNLFDHVVRLVDQDAQFTNRLPVGGTAVELERGRVYDIREVDPMGSWALYQY